MSTKGKGKSISQRTREQAALFCQVKASNPGIQSDTAMESLGIPDTAFGPAWDARLQTVKAIGLLADVVWTEWWAEAESLLRTGWCPGKEV